MFNNINDNNRDLLFDSQVNAGNIINLASVRSNLLKNGYQNSPYVDKTDISANAIKLFQKDLDIKNFTKIAVKNPEDISYLEKMQELFNDGVVDPFEDEAVKNLVTNSKLLDDLGL